MEHSAQTIDGLKAEIEERMGVCPSFFLLPDDLAVSQQLWAAACFGYLDAPFPSLFKERLFSYLSRFSKAPYWVKRHAAFLLGAGNVAGDSGCAAMTPEEVVDTLQSRLPGYTEVSRCLTIISQLEAPFGQWGEDVEDALFPCLAAVFLRSEGAEESERELQRLFGSALYDRLVWFLGFIKTAHFWTETHPELELEADVYDLFDDHPEFAAATTLLPQPGSGALFAGETILIVDDDEPIRDSLRLLLEFEGLTVVTCEDASSALSRITEIGDSIDVMMIDVTMPDINGPECLARIRKLYPKLPALMASGFSESDLAEPLPIDIRTRFIMKPCPRHRLVDLISTLLKTADSADVSVA
ncbi:MAG: CheY-like chemotaxis protein [Porticoccaceae bacterium]|jgi:CheY-like chemotaxis protein